MIFTIKKYHKIPYSLKAVNLIIPNNNNNKNKSKSKSKAYHWLVNNWYAKESTRTPVLLFPVNKTICMHQPTPTTKELRPHYYCK
jgi:hypothetical protein